jgi:RimJ/RimL family protein N-acetyltransferase
MIVRRATAGDALDVLAWRNDATTRAMSRISDVVDEAAHLAWFGHALEDHARVLLIGEEGGAKVGMVRIDWGAESEISININPAFRGRGRGGALLAKALAYIEGAVLAEIKPENVASQRLFERAGFVRSGEHDGMLRYVKPGRPRAEPAR